MSYDERGAPRQFRDQPRYAPTVERVYRNDQIEVTWEPSFCIHAGECIRGAPDVFDFARRPWVVVDNDTPDRIAETVRRCPTGALHYRRLDGAEQETVPADLVAWPVPNGPLLLRGPIKIVDRNGELIREDTRVTLCRCGASENKPFCDGSHRRIGFRG